MFRLHLVPALLLTSVLSSLSAQPVERRGYPLTPVGPADVRVEDAFWSTRLEANRTVSIPHALQQCAETGRIRNFATADSVLRGIIPSGTFCGRYGFDDSDVFKVIEGASFVLQASPDPALDAQLDTLIAAIARAQEPDGYLYTMKTMRAPNSWVQERWVNARSKGSHELYNLGHLYEAAVAHYAATGKRTLLDVALKSADLLVAIFGPGRMRTTSGHQVVEIGLVKLSAVTGNAAYLDLARFFIDERGRGDPPGASYNQDHLPVLEQTEAVGHAVRAGYLYAGMADVDAFGGTRDFLPVLMQLWDDVVSHKLYVTGGVGAVGAIEGYGPAYELPNLSAYCETCAGIALVYWSHRMFLLTGESRYMDLVERVLYNGFLSGVGMSGDRFFYPNPLESSEGAERSPWFTCACCPSNDVRFVPSIPGYVYAFRDDSLYMNLFVAGTGTVRLPGGTVRLKQTTTYPWSGDVSVSIGLAHPTPLVLHIRVPGWLDESPLPGGLYRYLDNTRRTPLVRVNGVPHPVLLSRGYAVIARTWNEGDTVTVSMPMEVRRVLAHPNVRDNRGKSALERGPIVYCLEGRDNPGGRALDLVIPDTARIATEFRAGLLGGLQVLMGSAFPTRRTIDGRIVADPAVVFTAIPYAAWAHRGRSPMTVWPARVLERAKPQPAPTPAAASTATASGGRGLDAAADQILPESSSDPTVARFHWWPKKGGVEWIQYTFDGRRQVSGVEVYWCDEGEGGGIRVPRAWRVLYEEGGVWKPVDAPSSSPVEPDTLNRMTFLPVETAALRLEVEMRDGCSAGVYEWIVNAAR